MSISKCNNLIKAGANLNAADLIYNKIKISSANFAHNQKCFYKDVSL